MRKKRLRGGTREQQTTGVPERTARVRNRLIASVAVVSLGALGAGAFGIADAIRDLTDSRRLAGQATTASGAVALAHALADERDTMTEYVAGGRTDAGGAGAASEEQRAGVDRQIEEFRASAPDSLRHRLAALPELRRRALAGPDDALAVFTAYTATVQALHAVETGLVQRLPGRARPGEAVALPALGRAVEEASATRGLFLAALAARGAAQTPLLVAAQQRRLQEQAALDDFHQLAPAGLRAEYARTVGGPQTAAAEARLARLAARPQAVAAEPERPGTVRGQLTARVDQMRGLESGLGTEEMARLAGLREHDTTALEVRGALAALAFLLILGTGVQSARSVTRPLAALRLGARRVCADPVDKEPVAFRGRDDEFAEVARSVNVLHGTIVRLRERVALLEGERNRLDVARQDLADERDALRARCQEIDDRMSGLSGRVHATFVSLSRRTLGLVERQLTVIESMEAHEADPDRLEVLFKLDHLATRMRRHNENLLTLAGADHHSTHSGPVPLLDILRAAVSEIERYERVRIHSLPARAQLAGFAADDVSHLVAELLENATTFSPPDVQVQVSGWLLENGEVMLSIQDEGIGMPPERLDELNALLAEADPDPRGTGFGEQGDPVMGLGLYVVARLAARHGVRVQLREQRPGGITAVVVLPGHLLPAEPPAAATDLAGNRLPGAVRTAPHIDLPGVVAEANSHTLHGRSHPQGPPPVVPGPRRSAPWAQQEEHTIQLTTVRRPAPAPEEPHPAAPPQPAPPHPAAPYPTPPHSTTPYPAGRHSRSATPPPATPAPAPIPEPRWQQSARPAPAHGPAGPAAGPSTAAGAAPAGPAMAPPPPGYGATDVPGMTGNGLPKRTPRVVARKPVPLSVRQGVDAEALRRKLAGFQQGARDGRRDVEVELTHTTGLTGRDHSARDRGTDRNRAGAPDEGGTVEEARG
ncbi:nitrate- and nitrite sensing domain-containing protein [Streptomyces sp. DSM 40473]|uniref:histidine kinase n=1 Tax=Streptomyces hesseae TaxID=3075519 RepID=A0ABU2SPP3_9ACTN|nr:nitrate- and nitrite sensing domain-containing protein [Streptomyces sp. DSM 40473]